MYERVCLMAVDVAMSLQLTFKATRPRPPGGDGSAGALDVGQWSECVARINVSGGGKCAGVPDKQSILVRLRAYVIV